jgi:FLVCR family MFS transporter 7
VPLLKTIRKLAGNRTFYLVFIPFTIYVGFFNALSALINQILEPYGFSETQAGIAGGILIIVGIIAAALIAPLTDRTHAYVLFIKLLIPLVAIGYLVLLFAPPTRSEVFVYIILGVLGAASFSVLPVALEYVVEVTFPVGPEVSSVLLWTGGQLLGGIFTIIMTALKDNDATDPKGNSPPGNMRRALIFQAVIACIAAVLPMGLGLKIFGLDGDARRRMAVDDGEQMPGNDEGRA